MCVFTFYIGRKGRNSLLSATLLFVSLKILENHIYFLLLTLTGDNQEESAKQVSCLTLQYGYNLQMKLNPDIHC